jgi:hypothetical protein
VVALHSTAHFRCSILLTGSWSHLVRPALCCTCMTLKPRPAPAPRSLTPCFRYLLLILRPYLRETANETKRVAELLTQLPNEVGQ